MKQKTRSIELLSPARDLTCGLEAIRHGADAVYIGAPKFGARSAAGNSLDDIRELCDFAHLYGVRIYVTVNTILKDDELEDARLMVWDLWRAGVDALIVQDMGLLELDLPPIPLHSSTQMDNRSVEKVQFLESVGFNQVVLARELSLAEIRNIAANTTVPLEVFVHGALCVSYSGQCYISAALNGRSANRGECAQYCRLPYTMVDAEGREILHEKHLLSLKDMNRSDFLEDLMDAGASSFKIEGRLKDVSYVKNVTAYYRKKIDEILVRRPEYRRASYGTSHCQFEPVVEKSFNRGFTPFFMKGERTADITAFDTPKSLGEPVGRVKDMARGRFKIAGTKALNNGDGLAFFNRKGELEGFRVNRVDGNIVYPLDMPDLQPKMLLYRNYDNAFEKQLSRPTAERKLATRILFSDNTFGFSLEMEDESGARINVTQAFEKEQARRPQEENIRTQLAKLGNTAFEAVEVEVKVKMSDNWFVPSSLLAEMRRLGVEKLMTAHKIRYHRELTNRKADVKGSDFPLKELTYLGNVANGKAAEFYREHGVKTIDPAFELAHPENVPLMFTKHCLRYSMGWCPTYQKVKSPYREPYYLLYKDRRLRLQFDCRHCQMLVFEEKENN